MFAEYFHRRSHRFFPSSLTSKSVPNKGLMRVCQMHSIFTLYNCIVLLEFLQWEIRVAFPGESQLRQSLATQPSVHAGCVVFV